MNQHRIPVVMMLESQNLVVVLGAGLAVMEIRYGMDVNFVDVTVDGNLRVGMTPEIEQITAQIRIVEFAAMGHPSCISTSSGC